LAKVSCGWIFSGEEGGKDEEINGLKAIDSESYKAFALCTCSITKIRMGWKSLENLTSKKT